MNGDEVNIFDTLKIEVHDGVQSGMNNFFEWMVVMVAFFGMMMVVMIMMMFNLHR